MFIGDIKHTGNKLFFIFSVILFFSTGYPVNGQQPEPDRLYAHVNKLFYVSGETIQFKVYIFNASASPSDLIHADLIDEKGDIINEQILKISNNTSYGSLEIPLSQSEGIYFLRIYSAWNLNFTANFNFVKTVPIYNDFNQSFESIMDDTISMENINTLERNNNYLDITILDITSIHTRGSIKLDVRDIQHRDGELKGNISVSVWDIDKCGFTDQNFVHEQYERQTALNNSSDIINYPPEKSILIEGNIFETDSRQPVTSKVLSVYNTTTSTFMRINSDKGEFSFEIPAFTGSANLQVINMNPFQPKVNLVERKKLSEHIPIPKTEEYVPERSSLINKYLYYSRLRRKIKELYNETSHDSIKLVDPPVLPFKPDRSYNIDKYQLLRNVEEFVREAVVNTSHIIESGEKKLLLFNQETRKFFMSSPWFLVDGHFIFNDSLTYNIPFNMLKRIDVYNTNKSILEYFEPIMIQGGVVAVYTKNNYLIDYIESQPNTLSIEGLTTTLEESDYQNLVSQSSPDQKPYLNPLIYWNPELRFNESGEVQFEILTNDVSGYYLIHIEGIDAAGKPLSGQIIIEVHP